MPSQFRNRVNQICFEAANIYHHHIIAILEDLYTNCFIVFGLPWQQSEHRVIQIDHDTLVVWPKFLCFRRRRRRTERAAAATATLNTFVITAFSPSSPFWSNRGTIRLKPGVRFTNC
jgi:hypothetical protein